MALERAVNETTLSGSSGSLETAARLNLQYRVSNRLILTGLIRAAQDEYQGIKRKDNRLETGLGCKYDLAKRFYLAAEYRFFQQGSTFKTGLPPENNDYDRQQLFLTLGAKM